MQHETERERAERLKKTFQRRGSYGRNILRNKKKVKHDLQD